MKIYRIVGGFALFSALLWMFTGITLFVPMQIPPDASIMPFSEAMRGAALSVAHVAAIVWWFSEESFR